MTTAKKENEKQLVQFSVRAQDFILKKQMGNYSKSIDMGADDAPFNIGSHAPMLHGNVDLNNYLEDGSAVGKSQDYLNDEEGDDTKKNSILELPKIQLKSKSPFKGFLDTSIVSHKLRKTINSEGGVKSVRNKSVGLDSSAHKNSIQAKVGLNDKFMAATKNKNKMSPKVLETWINETLSDAEHLDIPGVILKPEQKNPISRYGIDRHFL